MVRNPVERALENLARTERELKHRCEGMKGVKREEGTPSDHILLLECTSEQTEQPLSQSEG